MSTIAETYSPNWGENLVEAQHEAANRVKAAATKMGVLPVMAPSQVINAAAHADNLTPGQAHLLEQVTELYRAGHGGNRSLSSLGHMPGSRDGEPSAGTE